MKQTSTIFEDFQKKLDEYLTNLRLSVSLLWNISSNLSNTTSLIHIDPKVSRKKRMQNQIYLIIEKFTNLLSRARQLPLRPHQIIERIHRTLHQLKSINIQNFNRHYRMIDWFIHWIKLIWNSHKSICMSIDSIRNLIWKICAKWFVAIVQWIIYFLHSINWFV